MKKFLSLVLALCMLLSLGTSAFAATITESGNQSVNTTVRYGVDVSYTISIPENVTIGANGTGAAQYTVSDAMIPAGENIYITTDSANRVDDTFYLTNINESSVKVPYEITTDGIVWDDNIHNRTMVFPQSELLLGPAVRDVTFSLTDDVIYSGTYNDVLTTTVAVGLAVYGARQFPEDYNTIVWPEIYDDAHWNEQYYEYQITQSVNVWQSKTHEWYPQFRIGGRKDDVSAHWLSTDNPSIIEENNFPKSETLMDFGGYWGHFDVDKMLYFGEEFQLVGREFYDFIMLNTTPVNMSDYYTNLEAQTFQMNQNLGEIPAEDFQFVMDEVTINDLQHHYLFIVNDTASGMFGILSHENNPPYHIWYVEGFGWIEPLVAEDLDDMASLMAQIVPTNKAPIITLPGNFMYNEMADWWLANATPIN